MLVVVVAPPAGAAPGAPVVVVVVVEVDVASGVEVPVVVDVVDVSEEPPQAANEATSAKLAAARAIVWNLEVIKRDRLLLCLRHFLLIERQTSNFLPTLERPQLYI